jgi:hypothetical protein
LFDLSIDSNALSLGCQYPLVSGIGILDGILSQVHLSCNENTKTKVAMMKYGSVLIGCNEEGKTKWAIHIEAIRSEQLLEQRNPMYGISWLITAN